MIESPHNPQIRAAVALHKRSERDKTGQFLIEGRSEIRRAIAAGISVETLFSTPGIDVSDLAGVGRVLEIGEAAFQRLAYGRDGLVAVATAPAFSLHRLRLSDPALVLVVTSIEKPGNLGAMLRSADATGAAVIVADPLTDLVNPNVVRASLGTLFTVPVATTTTPVVIAFLRDHSIAIAVADVAQGIPPWDTNLGRPIALVIGSEHEGISPTWLEAADLRLRLPMRGQTDSLNASATAAILLYEATRQRSSPEGA